MPTNASGIVNAMSVDVEDYFHVAALAQSIDGRAGTTWSIAPKRTRAGCSTCSTSIEYQGDVLRARLGGAAQSAADPRDPRPRPRSGEPRHEPPARLQPDAGRNSRRKRTNPRRCSKTSSARRCLAIGPPRYSITRRSLWALDILREAGFLYDSSIFPIRHDMYGIPDASHEPAHFDHAQGRHASSSFRCRPRRCSAFTLPVSGGGYFRILPYWLTRCRPAQAQRSAGAPIHLLSASLGSRSRHNRGCRPGSNRACGTTRTCIAPKRDCSA